MDPSSKDKTPKAESPAKLTGLRTSEPKKVAAGIPAVISSAKHVFSEMGILRGFKAMANLNQKGGIDCPGCAWPDPDDERSPIAEYCENGAKAIAEEATTKKLGPAFFKTKSVSELSKLSDYEIGKKGRIAQPMYLPIGSDHYQAISWEAAYKKIGAHLNALESPDQAIFYTSGRTSNEAAFLYQLFVREFGTNNMPDCSNMCHESSGVALNDTLGIGKGSVTLDDFYKTEVILILGQNPGTNHPRMLSALQKAKENGATIIAVNPIMETGLLNFKNPQEVKALLGSKTKLSDIYLQVKINGDMALLQALVKLMMAEEKNNAGKVFDLSFISKKTMGFHDYLTHIESLDLDTLIATCGISLVQLQQVASILSNKNKIIACWAMGLTQHKNAVATIQEVVNLLLLKGSIGKPGAGTCPVRGHSNVQGDRTMGIYEKPPKELLDSLEKEFNFKPPRKNGYDTVESIRAMSEGRAKVFFAMGGNFLSATPDTLYTAQALQRCDLTVQVSTKLNRSHLIHGKEALILPCLGRTDKDIINGEQQFVSVENSMGVVHSSKGSLQPISELLQSEPSIVCNIAKATLKKSKVNWDHFLAHYNHIRDSIEACIPGFKDYNNRVQEGFYLPNTARENTYTTPTGKAHFTISDNTPIPLEKDDLMMMTVRSHDQFNTTIYGLNDRYRGVYNERRVIFMNPADISKFGLKEGDLVDLYNFHDKATRVAKKFIPVPYNIPQQCCTTYFPETNVLVPISSTADKSNTPTSKSVVIKIKIHQLED
ncbi:oxidoreductase alpha (molybdopterin) subunit [Arenibacter nanhaiticus]|uniref:Oxidoreductase alpha (Molybdopterin) subunit n=1 Tax=Arenibacter nanhaiticus TaxID=558155 RepID=A0A1M6K4F0_9FLAO|nr:FdhF/YdeP family oxidoreductase [Arenibacter nanhaiticus]SHJ53817.1 oxidoreductase alpha (molybdopterin) subunit [Arenibacter nanhaiticus]